MKPETEKTYPLTEIQRAYYVGRQESEDGTRILYEFRCEKPVPVMEKALNRIIQEQASMQIIFTKDGRQRLPQRREPYTICCIDLSYRTREDAEEFIENEFYRNTKENYDIFHGPLFSMTAFLLPDSPQVVYHFGVDMMIADGMSLRFLIHKVIEYCGEESTPYPMDRNFLDYCSAKEQERQDTNSKWNRDHAYWMKRLDNFPSAPDFPASETRKNRRSYSRREMEISAEQWEQLKSVARGMNMTPSTYLLGAYAYVIGLYSGKKEFALNLPVFDRMDESVKETIGDFTSILLIPVSMEQAYDFPKFCRTLQFRMIDALRHKSYSGLEFMREIAREKGSRAGIYPVVFTSMVYENQQMDIDDTEYEMTRGYSQTSQVILDCQIMANRNKLYVFWDFDQNSFAEGLIDAMFAHFQALVRQDTKCLRNIEEKKKVAWTHYEQKMQLHLPSKGILGAELDRNAMHEPDSLAAVDVEQQWTYAQLAKAVWKIAAALQKRGVQSGDGVMLEATKTVEMYAAILAILRCGAFYVPYMPDTPESRYEDMKRLAGASWNVTPKDSRQMLTEPQEDFAPVLVCPETLAYIIFTSGSTGKPKGVMITHGQAWNTIYDINTRFQVTSNDRILGISELTFDLSVYDLFGAVMAGAAVVFTQDHHHMHAIRRLISDYRITIWNSVPALMSLLLDTEEDVMPYYRNIFGEERASIRRSILNYHSLRLVLLSGDYIPVTLPDTIRSTYPHSQVISLGGATEGAIWSIFYPIDKVEKEWTTIPYGYPLSNQTMYVLDWKGNLAAPCTAGEIWIGGAGVAVGYAGSEELTQQSFVTHPELGRIYRTGDYGMLTADGYMTFLGRKDQQVKINGYRVELDEISAKAQSYPGVDRAVAALTGADRNVLVLFYTAEEYVAAAEFQSYLERELMSYMVPRQIYKVDRIPLTANGKVDRRALEAMRAEQNVRSAAAPSTEREKHIFQLFCDVLQTKDFSIEDDFFEIGGDSLKGIALFNLLEKEYEVTLTQLFQFRTVRSLAQNITERDTFGDKLTQFRDKVSATIPSGEDDRRLDQMEEEMEQRVAAERSESVLCDRHYSGILLTGSTGYLGAYLVRDLLEQTDAVLHLLIRGNEPEQRLKRNMEYYFGAGILERFADRVQIWNGEMSLPDGGLSEEACRALWNQVDCVFHCGAKTTHYGKVEDFQKINVDSTQYLLEKCLEYHADFYFVSSIRVLDNAVKENYQLFDETYMPDCSDARELYSDSKIKSEQLIEAYRKKGVNCTVFRTGMIVADWKTGLIQRNADENAFYIVLRSFFRLNFLPCVTKKVLDLSYVDKVAEAMVRLIRYAPLNATYHVYNPNKLSTADFYELLRAADMRTPMEMISLDQMMERLQSAQSENRSIMDLVIMHSASYIPNSGSRSRMANTRSTALLRQCGFLWPENDAEYMRRLYQDGFRKNMW